MVLCKIGYVGWVLEVGGVFDECIHVDVWRQLYVGSCVVVMETLPNAQVRVVTACRTERRC